LKGSRLRAWWPVALWVAVIAAGSSIPRLRPPLAYVVGIDKAAHFSEYAVLGFVLFRACALDPRLGRRSARSVLALVLLAALAFGALDEVHQLWIPGRMASAFDWIADAFGAIVGASAGALLRLRRFEQAAPRR